MGTVGEEISAVSSHQVSGDLCWWSQDTHTPRDMKTQSLHVDGVCKSQDSATGPRLLRARLEAESLRDWKSPREIVAGFLRGRYQVSFPVDSLELILNSGSPGHGMGVGGRLVGLQLTLASRVLGGYVTEGWGPGYP